MDVEEDEVDVVLAAGEQGEQRLARVALGHHVHSGQVAA